MAAKGDRARLEPVAKMLFCDGKSLTAIEEILDVSRQTLTDWKEWGGWDKAKAAKDSYEADLLNARDRIMVEVKETPLKIGVYVDTLSKLDALLDRRAKAAREAAEAIARQRGEMFLSVVQDLIEFGRANAPELSAALDENFEALMQYGRERYAG